MHTLRILASELRLVYVELWLMPAEELRLVYMELSLGLAKHSRCRIFHIYP